MKNTGIALSILLLCSCIALAQNTQSTGQANSASHNAAAQSDRSAADANKDEAKDQGTKSGEEREKADARLNDAAAIMHELLGAPDNGIPKDVLDNAKCVAVVPSMIKGGFIFGAEHGRGVATCRTSNGWSAPAFFVVTGGSWGAQIGGQATDLVMLIMNQRGMDQLLSSKFKIGGDASAAAGPIGRDASASTDWKMRSEVLTYSRARGLFAGATLNGAVIKEDQGSMTAFYGHKEGFRPTLTGQVKAPAAAQRFLSAVREAHTEAVTQKPGE